MLRNPMLLQAAKNAALRQPTSAMARPLTRHLLTLQSKSTSLPISRYGPQSTASILQRGHLMGPQLGPRLSVAPSCLFGQHNIGVARFSAEMQNGTDNS